MSNIVFCVILKMKGVVLMQKVLVIGGGPAGMTAAIMASGNNTEVTIMEKNLKCGKKLLLTGNGHCNYWNEDTDIKHFHSSNDLVLKEIITSDNLKKAKQFIKNIGIVPLIKNGYYYPFSNQSFTMLHALITEANYKNVKMYLDTDVKGIKPLNKGFEVLHNGEVDFFDKVIIATGSMAFPKTGSDGFGYELAKKLDHNINRVEPSLVQIFCSASFLKEWAGIRTHAKVSLYVDDEFVKEEEGELQCTKEGISGIVSFNLSREASRAIHDYHKVVVKINFFPFLNNDVDKFMNNQNKLVKNHTVGELLEGILHYKLAEIILKEANVSYNSEWNNLKDEEKKTIIDRITAMSLNVIGTNNFNEAQTCSGGVSLDDINPKTMESVHHKGLFFAGEIIDIDGDCGGYNLMNAWVTGMLAGLGAKNDSDK